MLNRKMLLVLAILYIGLIGIARSSEYYYYMGGAGPKNLPFWAIGESTGDYYVIDDWYGDAPATGVVMGIVYIRRASDNRPMVANFFYNNTTPGVSTNTTYSPMFRISRPKTVDGEVQLDSYTEGTIADPQPLNTIEFAFQLLYYSDTGEPYIY